MRYTVHLSDLKSLWSARFAKTPKSGCQDKNSFFNDFDGGFAYYRFPSSSFLISTMSPNIGLQYIFGFSSYKFSADSFFLCVFSYSFRSLISLCDRLAVHRNVIWSDMSIFDPVYFKSFTMLISLLLSLLTDKSEELCLHYLLVFTDAESFEIS